MELSEGRRETIVCDGGRYLAKTTTPLSSMPAAAMAGAMPPQRVFPVAAAGVVVTVHVSPLPSCSLRPVNFTFNCTVDVVDVRPRSLFQRRRGCRPRGQVRVFFYPDRAVSVKVRNKRGEL